MYINVACGIILIFFDNKILHAPPLTTTSSHLPPTCSSTSVTITTVHHKNCNCVVGVVVQMPDLSLQPRCKRCSSLHHLTKDCPNVEQQQPPPPNVVQQPPPHPQPQLLPPPPPAVYVRQDKFLKRFWTQTNWHLVPYCAQCNLPPKTCACSLPVKRVRTQKKQ